MSVVRIGGIFKSVKTPYNQLEICENCSKALSKIFEISQKISSSLNQDTIVREVCKAIIEDFGFRMVWIGIITPDSFEVKPVYQEGFEYGYLSSIKVRYDESPLGMGPTGTAIRTRTPSVINDYESDPRFAPWLSEAKKRGYKSGCAFPMIALEKVLGSINVYNDRKHAFDSNTIMLLQLLANNAAIALHNARLYGELKGIEERYRYLVENSPDVIGIILDSKIAFFNEAGLRILGYTRDEIIGKEVSEIIHPEDREVVLKDIEIVLSGGSVHPREYRLLNKKGDIIYVEATRKKIEYEGKPAVQCIVRDISERKKRENETKELEDRYRSLIEDSPDAIGVIYNGRIVFCNNRTIELLGYTYDEINGKGAIEFISPEDRERASKNLMSVLSGATLPAPREYKLVKKNGECIDIELTSSRIVYRGKPAIQGVMRDVSERKKRDARIKEMEERYRNLAENSPDGIGVTCNGRAVFINKKWAEALGYTIDEIIGRNPIEHIHPEDRERAINNIKTILSGESLPSPREYRAIRKNGEIVEMEAASSRIIYEGKTAIQSIFRDISERKKYEKKLKEMKERYRSLVENSPDAIGAVCDGRIVFINDKGLEMFGYTRDEIIGMNVAKTVSPEDGERVLNDIKIVLSDEYIPPREYKLLKKNGETFDVEITRSKIEYEGKPAIQSTIRDISERKKRDNEMREYIRELEILNKVAIERELRMIELKKEVNKLLTEIGREKMYKITE
ncbi:MAG: PAS domain S-box protein [Nitrospinae bacterium]|nr:PAS domain S-box protein [Nitrospinota bacterium]